MKQKKYKFFWRCDNESKKIIDAIEWNEEKQDYYAFIKDNIDAGYHQISITSEMMLDIIEKLATSTKTQLAKIELMEEDGDEDEQLRNLIEETKKNRGVIIRVTQTLRYLEDESSIEIKRVTFVDESNRNIVFIQVNGVVGAQDVSNEIVQCVTNYIKEYMN